MLKFTRRSLLMAAPAIIIPGRVLAQAIGEANGITASAGSSAASNVSLTPYVGLVGTRGTVNQQVSTGNLYANSRSFHYARTGFSTVQIALGSWYCNGVENAMGGAVTYQAALEYPANTFNSFTWSGSTSVTIANNTTIITDPLNVTVPLGATFYIRVFQDAHLATAVATGWTGYSTGGDGIEVSSTSVSSKTTSGTISFTTGLGPIFPMAIIGVTNIPSVACCGDSRTMGLADTADASGDIGETARSIGPSYGYINAGCSGENGYDFGNYYGTTPTAATNRIALIKAYCTHAISEYGINDLKNNVSGLATLALTVEAILESCWQQLPTLKVFQTTIPPYTTSTDTWETLVNQTPVSPLTTGASGPRQLVNAWLRAGGLSGSGLSGGYFDVTSVVESSLNSGLWGVNGTADWYTSDGLHETQVANLAIQSAKVIPVSAIHR